MPGVAQSWHVELLVAPDAVPEKPLGHKVHEEAPLAPLHLPEGQLEHVDAPPPA